MLISRSARHKYQFDDDLFQADGGVRLGEYHEARRFAVQMSRRRLQPVPASDVQAMSLLDEALRLLLRQYELQNPGVLRRGLEQLQAGMGGALEPALIRFTDEFPPRAVYYGDIRAADHLAGDTAANVWTIVIAPISGETNSMPVPSAMKNSVCWLGNELHSLRSYGLAP